MAGYNGGYRSASDESLTAYLKMIGKIPLLSREEEIACARRIQQGDSEAERELIRHNLKYVVSVASRYKGRGMDLLDIISEGNLGLIQAAKRFDPDRGVKFITYAVWWVRQAITKALSEKSHTVRLPIKQGCVLSRIPEQYREFQKRLYQKPTREELAETLNVSLDELESLLRVYQPPLSLDAPVNEAEGTNHIDLMPDTSIPSVEEQAAQNSKASVVNAILNTLPRREQRVLRMRFGFDGRPQTLEEIGRKLNLSRERIRQIEKKAKGRLKACQKVKTIRQESPRAALRGDSMYSLAVR